MREKADAARQRTQTLYEIADGANNVVTNELQPKLAKSKDNIKQVDKKTRITKDAVETLTKYVYLDLDFIHGQGKKPLRISSLFRLVTSILLLRLKKLTLF